ncbi:hypothetical protein KC640_01200, partial [Candidatus Dojkabacteria bacterium]|nr:hypothetical protein [Candidatus Dojkabacteria bacterium]
PDFADELYGAIATESIYITNIAKCTQADARPLANSIFREYLPSMLQELEQVNPQFTFTLGNQVSSTLLQKPISVSNYLQDELEALTVGDREINVFPAFYPVGQGTPNMPKAVRRIRQVLAS